MTNLTPKATAAVAQGKARRTEKTFAILALGFLAIPMLITAATVWLVLGRPIFFTQGRAGLGGRAFCIKKFRTMTNMRDKQGNLLPDNLRQPSSMRLLRRMRLDELPQLFTIVQGDMAFVGPRPLLPSTIEEMGDLGRWRCRVRPGLTGWAQVNGNTLLSEKQKLAMDIWYVDNRSLGLDLRILLLTLVTVVRGERVLGCQVEAAEAHLKFRENLPSNAKSRQQQCV